MSNSIKTIADIVKSFKRRDKTAIVYKTGFRTFELTYGQLHGKILKTIGLLENLGLKKGDKLILWGHNSPQWGIVFLAAASRGIVVVPIDFLATGDFVKKIQDQVKAKAIFSSEYKPIPKLDIKNPKLEHLDQLIKNIGRSSIDKSIKPDDLLEIIYTSGTTGDPKGVLISHANMAGNINAITKVISVNPGQTFLSLLPLSHLFEQNPGFLAPLSQGCAIVYIRGLKPSLIFDTLGEERITNIVIVPRLLKLFESSIRREAESRGKTKIFNKLLEADLPPVIKKLAFRSVHKKFGREFMYFISGGAPLSDELRDFWTGLGFDVVEGYGLTETSPVLTVNLLEEGRRGSVGKALPGVQIKIGRSSEIYAKGPNVTSGYFKRSDLTRKHFSNGWFKTGDIGEIDEDGYLFMKGRKKDVIVTGAGMNVYPEDVEEALHRHGAKEAAVIGLPSEAGEEVHAEIILRSGRKSVKKVVDAANQDLNESQKITSYGEWHKEDFPRTTTMKIKKPLVLAEVTGRGSEESGESTKTASDKHSRLTRLVARVAGIKPDKIKQDSVLTKDLHLTSVQRIELVALAEQEFNTDINEEDIGAKTTVADLEKTVKKRTKADSSFKFRGWLLSWPVRVFRMAFNFLIVDNLVRLFVRRSAEGRENLEDIKGPVIFIANHVGYLDFPVIAMSLPLEIKQKLAPAAAKEYFESEGVTVFKKGPLKKAQLKIYFAYATIFAGAYPFPRESRFKEGLTYTGKLLDNGWHILFFPEGQHSLTGEPQPFLSGIGYIAKEMKVPIVPIKHEGTEKILKSDKIRLPRPGRATVKFGKPIQVDLTKSIPEIVQTLQNSVRDL